MKKSNIFLFWSLCSVLLLTSCHLSVGGRGGAPTVTVKTSGVMVKQSITVSDYKSIDVSQGIHLILTDGDRNIVTVETDEANLPYVDIYVSGNVLYVGMKPTKKNHYVKAVNVTVSARGVSNFFLSSAASVTAETTLVGNELAFDLSSASKFSGEVACKKVTVDASSAARFDVSGRTDYFGMDISSASSVNASKLIAKKVVCDTSSASSASVYATEELSVDASSASLVRYDGDAKIVRIDTSSGAVASKR